MLRRYDKARPATQALSCHTTPSSRKSHMEQSVGVAAQEQSPMETTGQTICIGTIHQALGLWVPLQFILGMVLVKQVKAI